MNGSGSKRFSNSKEKGVFSMKKSIMFMVAAGFVVSLGTAYAADYNGATDFSGRS